MEVTALFMASKKLPLFDISIVTCVDDEKINNAHHDIYTFSAEKAEKRKKAVALAVQQAT